ncbi:MAG: DUF11 domain-containing protein, partial [Gammaproteobacteria bacterium]|nr:DUF11 domain-containing protein [Gammaproteobacteria bacterium]
MNFSQYEARLSGPSFVNALQRCSAVFCLVMLTAFAGSAHAQTAERVLDWDAVAWTPLALSQTYTISGRNIVVTYAGGRGGNLALVNPSPGLENINTGGLLANQFSLNVQTEYLTVPPGNPDPLTNDNFVTVTLDFTDFPDGISGVDFNIFDIDRGPRDPLTGNIGFSDWVQVSAQTTAGATVTPVCTAGGRPPADFALPSPAPSFDINPGCILSGNARSAPTSTDGTANIMFPQSNIRSVTITYRNNTTNPTPALQLINIHDVKFLPAADISVDKVVDNATPVVGTNVQYTITMANAGPGDGTDLVLEDRLPAGLTYVSSSDGGVYNPATRTVTWPTLPLLGSGTAVVRTLTATVNPTGPYLNVAELTAATNTDPDSTPGNNIPAEDDQDDAPIVPNPFADLSLTKVVDVANPNVGDNVTFTVTLTNDGPVNGTGITVADNLPSGFTLVSTT